MENGQTKKRDICERTFKFSLNIIRLALLFPKTIINDIIIKQLIRSGTSVGANTEEAQDGLTRKEFVKSLSVALKEARETRYWLRICLETIPLLEKQIIPLINETEEIIKILTTIVKKSKNN